MKLIFRIQYRTLWGEEVRIIFDEDENQSVALSTRDGVEWQLRLPVVTMRRTSHLPVRYI